MKPWHLAVVLAIASALAMASSAPAATIAHWRFEEGPLDSAASGTDSIRDWSGNNVHGTPFGGPVYRSVPTVPGSTLALEFDGMNDRVFVPDDPVVELTQGLTLEAYVLLDAYPQNAAGLAQIVFRGDDRGGIDPYYLSVTDAGILRFHIEAGFGVGARVHSPDPVVLGEFLHVAGTLDDARPRRSGSSTTEESL
jgi:hypothetical protein